MDDDTADALLVACLCAAWCGTCREYQPVFEALQVELGAAARFAWVDIEEHDDALGDLDIDDFPTLLLARGDTTLFFGPVTPQAQTLARLVRSALAGELQPLGDVTMPDLPANVRKLT